MEKINQYKLKLRQFTAELNEKLDRNLRTLITLEAEIYDVHRPDLQNGEFDEVYVCRLVGTTIVRQGGEKPIVAKSKRSQSQKLRAKCWADIPEEKHYENFINKIIVHYEEVKTFLSNL